MAKSCIITAQVANPATGQLEDSQLHKQIKSYVFGDYKSAKEIYLATVHNEQFNKRVSELGNQLTYNSQNELELESILSHWNIKDRLPDNFEEKLRENFGLSKEIPYTSDNYHKLEDACVQFNKSIYGINNTAVVTVSSGKVGIELKETKTRRVNSDTKKAMERESQLNIKLRNLLKRWGVAVGALDTLEERLNDGVTDFSGTERSANGLVELIRLAKGNRGEKALPEEFAHFVVRAMENTPAMQRVVKLIKDKNLARGIMGDAKYEQYALRYSNNVDLLAEEAAGQLLAIHLLNAEGINDEAEYATLLPRTIKAINQYFSKFNDSEIIQAINEVNENFAKIAESVAAEEVNLNAAQIRIGGVLSAVNSYAERTKKLQETLKKILQNEVKRLKIMQSRNPQGQETKEQAIFVKALLNSVRNKDVADCIFTYSEAATNELEDFLAKLKDLAKDGSDWNTIAPTLRSLRNTIYSYTNVVQNIQEAISIDDRFDDKKLKDEVRTNINQLTELLSKTLTEVRMLSLPAFKQFLIETLGTDKIVVNNKTITADDIVNMDVTDIGVFDRWLNSAGESSSYLIKAYDHAVKQAHSNARQRTNEISKQIVALTKKLQQQGYKNQDFIFEHDERDNQTGWYVSEVDRTKYHKEYSEYEKSLYDKYEGKPNYEQSREIKDLLDEWVLTHTEYDEKLGMRIPSRKLYRSTAYDKLKDVQKKYLEDFIALKHQMDMLMDGRLDRYKTIKIRKDLPERITDSKSLKDGGVALADTIKELYVDSSSDTDFGQKSVIQDFEGNDLRVLPKFYMNLRPNEKESDVSMDAVSTLTAYASMATEFQELDKIVDILEVGRNIVVDSDGPIRTRNGQIIQEILGRAGSLNNQSRDKNSSLAARLNDLMETQVYHRYLKDAGSIKNINSQKAIGLVNKYSAITTMAFSLLGGISNVTTGMVQMRIEAMGGQFFNNKDVVYADAKYAKELTTYMGEIGARVQTSWLALLGEKFNIMQDYEMEQQHKDYDKKWYNKLFSTDTTYFIQHSGEHWMQHRTFLALANSKKEALTDKDGKKISILDAYTKEYIDPSNHSLGARLVLKKGLKDKKGRTIITEQELQERAKADKLIISDKNLIHKGEVSELDFVNYVSRKSAFINNHMHGIYNKEDANAIQRTALGRLVIMYRKWIIPSMNRRFKKANFNYDIEEIDEGYYRSMGRFLNTLRKDLLVKNLNIVSRWNEMSDAEKANCKKATYECAFFIALCIVTNALFNGGDGDDDDNWWYNIANYQCRRLITELGVLTPMPIGVDRNGLKVAIPMADELITIFKSPAAGAKSLETLSNAFNVLNPSAWSEEAIITRGRYKDHYRGEKAFYDALPYNRTIYRAFHPEEAVEFYM